MIEQARQSLENYLKENIEKIKENINQVNSLKRNWLDIHPEYIPYDLQLDVEWTGTSGFSSYLWTDLNYNPFPKGPHAKGFKVVTKDWDDERWLHHRMDELYCDTSQINAARQALECI